MDAIPYPAWNALTHIPEHRKALAFAFQLLASVRSAQEVAIQYIAWRSHLERQPSKEAIRTWVFQKSRAEFHDADFASDVVYAVQKLASIKGDR